MYVCMSTCYSALSRFLLRGAPDYSADTESEFHAEAHEQLRVKDLPRVPTRRLEVDSNPQPSGCKAPNIPLQPTPPRPNVHVNFLRTSVFIANWTFVPLFRKQSVTISIDYLLHNLHMFLKVSNNILNPYNLFNITTVFKMPIRLLRKDNFCIY